MNKSKQELIELRLTLCLFHQECLEKGVKCDWFIETQFVKLYRLVRSAQETQFSALTSVSTLSLVRSA